MGANYKIPRTFGEKYNCLYIHQNFFEKIWLTKEAENLNSDTYGLKGNFSNKTPYVTD